MASTMYATAETAARERDRQTSTQEQVGESRSERELIFVVQHGCGNQPESNRLNIEKK